MIFTDIKLGCILTCSPSNYSFYVLIVCCILILTGCGKNDITKLEKNLSSMELTGDLIVQKVYYHNVADYKKEAQDGFLRLRCNFFLSTITCHYNIIFLNLYSIIYQKYPKMMSLIIFL